MWITREAQVQADQNHPRRGRTRINTAVCENFANCADLCIFVTDRGGCKLRVFVNRPGSLSPFSKTASINHDLTQLRRLSSKNSRPNSWEGNQQRLLHARNLWLAEIGEPNAVIDKTIEAGPDFETDLRSVIRVGHSSCDPIYGDCQSGRRGGLLIRRCIYCGPAACRSFPTD